jgi:hypothetical protein
MSQDGILFVASVVLFVLAACNIRPAQLTAAGLACYVLTQLV